MPHNLYLHSSIIQTRAYPRNAPGKRMALLYGTWDSMLSLTVAFFINAAILILWVATGQLHACVHAGPACHPDPVSCTWLAACMHGGPARHALIALMSPFFSVMPAI